MTPRASCSGVGEALSAHPPHTPSSFAVSRIGVSPHERLKKKNLDPCATADRNLATERRLRSAKHLPIAGTAWSSLTRGPGEPPLPLPQHRALVYSSVRCRNRNPAVGTGTPQSPRVRFDLPSLPLSSCSQPPPNPLTPNLPISESRHAMVQMMPYNKNLRVPLDVASVGSLNPLLE
jgi:hypothetical protein